MKTDAIMFDHIEQQLELAGEMRKHVREILKRIWVFEELSGMSFLDQKNMLLDLLCDLSDFQNDAYAEIAEHRPGQKPSETELKNE